MVRAKLLLKFECFANVFVALNFVTLLDFSEQAFILETVMRSWLGDETFFNNNNNKLYLHDHNKVLQYCKSYLKLIMDSM